MSVHLAAVVHPTDTKTAAIIGAGYAGMAAAWNLVQKGVAVTLFDPLPLGTGTSGISAGLLHVYMGPEARLAWQGREALAATQRLLDIASAHSDQPVYHRSGILRIALGDKQKACFYQRSCEHDDITWLEPHETTQMVSGAVSRPAILINNGITVDGAAYLRGLGKACAEAGCQFIQRSIASLDELQDFDSVVVATGAAAKGLKELSHLPITPVKGQLLELKWPEGHPPLPCPVNSQVYCVMDPSGHSCYLGATYERGFASADADVKRAKELLMPKVARVLPFLADAEVIGVRAGVRASTPGHLPIFYRIDERCHALVGLGSKGLLYHAWLADLRMPLPSRFQDGVDIGVLS